MSTRFKVSLELSGQVRSYKKAFEYVKRNLLDKHDVTVFIHSWTYGDIPGAIKLYNSVCPVWEMVENILPQTAFSEYTNIANEKHPAYNTGCMWYSASNANRLRKVVSLHNNLKFDFAVRSRFDYALNRELPFEEIEENEGTLYVPNCVEPRVNDQFAFGAPHIIDRYSSVYDNFDQLYYDNEIVFNGENLLEANLDLHNLKKQFRVYVDMNNPFAPGQWNGTTHSLVRDDFSDWNNLRG